MIFLAVFSTSAILGYLVSWIVFFVPISQAWILYFLGLSENEAILGLLFLLNLFVYAFAEEIVKYFSAIFWYKKQHSSVTKKLLFYIGASAIGLAVLEKTIVILQKFGYENLQSLPWIATADLYFWSILGHVAISSLLYPFIKTAELRNNRAYVYIGLIFVAVIHASYNYYILQTI